MGAIGLNPIRLDRIGLDPIRINAIKLGVPGAASDRPYIDPEVLASLKAVCICYGKSNDDPDRAVVKNLVDPDNPFIISNAAFKLNSGFGKYSADFESFDWAVNISQKQHNKATISLNGRLCNHTAIEVDEMKVNIIGNVTELIYWYIANPDDTTRSEIRLTSGINTLPKSYAKNDGQTYNIGFAYISGDSEITITQIPSFEGAFFTDGINDLITSTKTAVEMGITNEVTVVSMIHQINANKNFTTTNNLRNESRVIGRNTVTNIGKNGIYGWYKEDLKGTTATLISNILGDKNDYTGHYTESTNPITNSKFYVTGYAVENGFTELSSIAWYWTIIANKVLTTDQINQVIAYFNLDRTLKPDILCDVKKQGITNDNHAEFGDKLIDFSGNGRDIQLNNIAWKGDSGIGKYEVDFLDSSIWNSSNSTITSSKIDCKNAISHIMLLYYSVGSKEYPDIPSFKVIKTGADIDYSYIDETGSPKSVKIVDGVNILPASHNTLYSGSGRFCGFGNPGIGNSVTITQIPSHAGALCLDGVNDFGKVTGMPVYKDYTFIIDYERISYTSEGWGGAIVSKSPRANNGAFISMMANSAGTNKQLFSFGGVTAFIKDDLSRILFWQTKYKSENTELTVGEGVDGDTLWLGTLRDNDSRFFNGAIYFLMSFPYSMSEFLIERQLKKHKLGTLYPDMVEFRPVIKTNVDYTLIQFYINNYTKRIYPGDYIPINTPIEVNFYLKNNVDELISFKVNGNDSTFKRSTVVDSAYNIRTLPITKSPQEIDITIDEYIRYEDIVQPYPVLLRFNDENGNEVSWGGKFRVGSTITRIGSFYENNLIDGLYIVRNPKLNGNNLITPTHVVEKSMVFTCDTEYLLDNNEPKCILSPSRLRIPNSSYKILGHIPDISGHGNHGVINNSAYVEGSGVNEDGSYQLDGVNDFVTIPTLSSGGKQVLMKVNWQNDYDIPGYMYDSNIVEYRNYIIKGNKEQIAYENASKTYIDGILNANLTSGDLKDITHNITSQFNETSSTPYIGCRYSLENFLKMSLYDFMLFDNISTDDKIKELNEYIGIEAKVELPPYYWDAYGKTNLDEDKNYTANLGTVKDVIEVSQPAIFAENWYDGNPEPVLFSPIINQTDYSIEVKANKMDNNFTMMLDVECDTPLPAFKAKFSMVGTAISVDLKYYINGGSKIIDVFKSGGSTEPVILDIPASERSFIYGTNTDNYPNILIEVLPADNGTRYGLTNTNFAYDKMSGYGGYNLSRFDKSWSSSSNTSIKVVQRNPYDITLKKLGGNSDWEFNDTELKVISNPVSVKFKSDKNIRFTCDYHYYPVGENSEGIPLGITSKDLIANEDTIITISPISQENIDKYNIDVNRGYYLVYFQLSSTLAVDEEVTIEMLPLYPNGLVYDGITDYSENVNVPAFTEFSYVFKRKLLSESTGSASMNKGLTDQQRAVVVDHINANGNIEGTSFGTVIPVSSLRDSDIIYSTTNNINGTTVSKGSKPDSNGIDIGRFVTWYKQMVFYKLMLYPKTIPLLQINFLKNLMEKDEIIDLNNKIFIQE